MQNLLSLDTEYSESELSLSYFRNWSSTAKLSGHEIIRLVVAKPTMIDVLRATLLFGTEAMLIALEEITMPKRAYNEICQ